jgi:beta-glucanase (GH16 family)
MATFDSYEVSAWTKADWANKGMFNCGWLPEHITFASGAMTIMLNATSSHGKPYTSGEYRTNQTFSYGTFETRMKPARASGIVSSFFLYTDSPWDEIDIEFLGKNTTQVQFNYFVNGVGQHEKIIDLGFDAFAAYHSYAIEYGNGYINWYVDGIKKWGVTSASGTLPSHPMQIMMNLWPGTGVDDWLGGFSYSTPLYAYYDYVKYTEK